jgi:hypothetical protein
LEADRQEAWVDAQLGSKCHQASAIKRLGAILPNSCLPPDVIGFDEDGIPHEQAGFTYGEET